MSGALDIRRDHRELVGRCLSLLSPGGTLWFSSNAKGFRLESEDFPEINIKDMSAELADEDFKGKKIPVCYTLTKE
jgi:23S rRNA G2069 N7-methylase RlmK/C1962 C5-methylase RlmI